MELNHEQPRVPKKSQPCLTNETMSFYVKATGNDESSMRRQLSGTKLENLRRERDHWRKRAEERQRLQDKKEEAWELFQRQASLTSGRVLTFRFL